jgi:carboxyl-terminal processing protease
MSPTIFLTSGQNQDHKRAILIGSETFGKGSVQSIIALDDGSALRLTTAKYYTPSGRCIHRDENSKVGGITPDIVIDIPREMEAKLQAQSEEIFAVGQKPKSIVKQEDQVRDEVLDRAIQLLNARTLFQKLQKG